MKQPLHYIFSISFCFLSWQLSAQDTTLVAIDSGPSLYIDYGKLLLIASDFEAKAEAGIGYQLKNRISIHVQAGWGRLEPSGAFKNGDYISEGYYGRAGLNYLLPLDATNSFYVGARYAKGRFDEEGSYTIQSLIWPDRTETYRRTALEADWFEVLFGSEKKLKKSNWRLGGYFSLRILNKRKQFPLIDTYAIPGYGRAFDKTVPAVNVYIKYAF